MEIDTSDDVLKQYSIHFESEKGYREWASVMGKLLKPHNNTPTELTPGLEEFDVSTPNFGENEDLTNIPFDLFTYSSDDEEMDQVDDEVAVAAKQNLVNGITRGSHIIAPWTEKRSIVTHKNEVYHHVPESVLDDLLVELDVVTTVQGRRAELLYKENLYKQQINFPLDGFVVKGVKDVTTCLLGNECAPVINYCAIIPEGEQVALLSYTSAGGDFSVLFLKEKSYPVVIRMPVTDKVVFITCPMVYFNGEFFGPPGDIGSEKILVLWGQEFRLRPYEELTGIQVPSLINQIDLTKVRRLEMAGSCYPAYLNIVFRIVEIDGMHFACLRNFETGREISTCSGCKECYRGNCRYMPIFRVPDFFAGNIEFSFVSSRYMPNIGYRAEHTRVNHQRMLGFGKGALISRSFRVPGLLNDYLDLQGIVTISDLSSSLFRDVHSRLTPEARPYVMTGTIAYPKCGGDPIKQERAILTARLMKLTGAPCGRNLNCFHHTTKRDWVLPHQCVNNTVVVSSGAHQRLVFKRSGEDVIVKGDRAPLAVAGLGERSPLRVVKKGAPTKM